MLSRVLFAAALGTSMLLTSVPAREAACQQDSKGSKPCPRNARCMSNTDCQTLRCNLTCAPNENPTGPARICQ